MVVFIYMSSGFNYDPTIISDFGCKLFNYFAYGMSAISPWCLVYISFERFIVIKYHSKRFLFKKKKIQMIFLILLFAFNISNKIDHWLKLYKKYSFDKFWLFYSQFIRGDINDVCRPLCPLECDSIKYEVFNSFTKISDNEFKNLFEINASMNNVIWANIYYDNLEYTSISQLPHMDILDLISSIGSNLSLFIGISFISLAEIFELFVEILLIFFESKKIKTQATSLLVPLSSPSKLSNENDSAYKKKKKRTYSV